MESRENENKKLIFFKETFSFNFKVKLERTKTSSHY